MKENKYIQAFKEAIQKLEEEAFSNNMRNPADDITIGDAIKNNIVFYIISADESDEDNWGYVNVQNEIEPWDIGSGGYDSLSNILLFLDKQQARDYYKKNREQIINNTTSPGFMDHKNEIINHFVIHGFVVDKEKANEYHRDLNAKVSSLTNLDVEWVDFGDFEEAVNNKYIKAFREACEKLEEKQDFSNLHWDEIPPEKHTEKQLNAINEFDNLVRQVQEGLITRKEFIQRADILYNDLPDFDWTRDSDAKLPNELFPDDNKVKNTNPSIQEILDGNYEINN